MGLSTRESGETITRKARDNCTSSTGTSYLADSRMTRSMVKVAYLTQMERRQIVSTIMTWRSNWLTRILTTMGIQA
jgi:hypothetical protein